MARGERADRHDVARHRPGLRGQGGAPRSAPGRPRGARPRGAPEASSTPRSGRSSRRSAARSRGDAGRGRLAALCREWAERLAPCLATPSAARRLDERGARACSSRAPRAPCSTSTTAPTPSSPARAPPPAAPAPAPGCRRPRSTAVLGVLKAYTTRVGAGPFPTELEDETGELPAPARQRVRHHHRAAAALRLARPGGRPLRPAAQRHRLAGPDQARRARRARRDPGLHRLRDRRGDAARPAGRPSRPWPRPSRSTRPSRAGSAPRSASSTTTPCRRRPGTTSAGSRTRSDAGRPALHRPAAGGDDRAPRPPRLRPPHRRPAVGRFHRHNRDWYNLSTKAETEMSATSSRDPRIPHLRPCPHCGKPVEMRPVGDSSDEYRIVCRDCPWVVWTPSVRDRKTTLELIASAWNRRVGE